MTTETDLPATYCALAARDDGSALHGTATEVRAWLLLEVPTPWREKATNDNDLPSPVQERLDDLITALPGGRLQFIKRSTSSRSGPFAFYLALTTRSRQELFHWQLDRYEELLDIDVSAVAQGRVKGPLSQEQLLLVCTNGKRDRCCAKFGRPVFQALAEQAPHSAWETTHIGGHRYAPTLVALPEATVYGFVAPQEAATLVAAQAGRMLHLPRFRGRSFDAPVVQAADYFARRESGILARDAWRSVEFEVEDGLSLVLEDTLGGRHRVELAVESLGDRLAGCNRPKFKPANRFRLVHYVRL